MQVNDWTSIAASSGALHRKTPVVQFQLQQTSIDELESASTWIGGDDRAVVLDGKVRSSAARAAAESAASRTSGGTRVANQIHVGG